MEDVTSIIERETKEEKLMKTEPGAVNTVLAKERTILAKERNAVGMAQLGLGIAAFGFVVIRFFVDAQYEWFLGIGVIFVGVSIWLFYHAFHEYMVLRQKLANLHNLRGHLDRVYISELE